MHDLKSQAAVNTSQALQLDAEGYADAIERPAYDAKVSGVLEKNRDPWGPSGKPMVIGIVAADSKTIYRAFRVWGMGAWVGVTQGLKSAGFMDLLDGVEDRRFDALFIPTRALLATEPKAASLSPPAHEDLVNAHEQLAKLSGTEREQVVLARIGQGSFRESLMKAFDGRCALTGFGFPPVLRASHIKPWRDSTNTERISADNGLLLRADVDALFDSGYVSIGTDGELLLARTLQPEVASALGISHLSRLPSNAMTGDRMALLEHHRNQIFLR